MRGGQVIGSSDATGESPKDRPVTPADLAATIYTLLGIDPQRLLHTADGRPVHVSRDGRVVTGVGVEVGDQGSGVGIRHALESGSYYVPVLGTSTRYPVWTP